MPAPSATRERSFLHPLHAILLAFPVALSCGAVLSDIAYLNSAVVQWSHFSAWLLAFTALFGGLVLAWAIVAFVMARHSPLRRPTLLYLVMIAFMWVLSVVNSFHHAKDAWFSVGPWGLIMSIVIALLALAAAWIGHSTPRQREIAR